MQDEKIISLYWERSQEAIAATSEKYGRYCHTVAWNILYDEQDSEECVNDTWLRAWNAMPPQRPTFLKAFLGKITRNLALNRYEAHRAARRGSGETALCLDELEGIVSGKEDTEEAVDRMALGAALNRFLEGLRPEERRIFLQRYWYMCPVREIAERAGCGESRIKMQLLRLRARLKEELEKEGIRI